MAFVRIVRHEVFAEDELWPTFLNLFHGLTRDEVIRRELLLREGRSWSREAAAESERNLRSMAIFSVARVLPVRAPGDGEVGLFVFTRDLWSLRLEQRFQVTDGQLDMLLLQLSERNILGRNKQATARFQLFPKTFQVGEVFLDRRVFGGRIALSESFDLIFGRDRGEVEGSRGDLAVSMPFYDLRKAWGFLVSAAWDVRVVRQLSGGEVIPYDIPETSETEQLGRAWRQRFLQASAGARLQVGTALKHRFSLGVGFEQRRADPAAEAKVATEQESAFRRDVLPTERREVFPFATWEMFRPTYHRYMDLSSYGLSEDVRTGPSLSLGVFAPLARLGSDRDALLLRAGAGWVESPAEGLVEVRVSVSGRLESGRLVDQVLSALLRGASPPLGPGRVVLRALWTGRRADSASTLVSLGGDNGLRGYASQALFGFGSNLFLANLEARSRALEWSSVHLGGVLFYDLGSVYESLESARLAQSVGLGLRFLFPQFNRFVYRVDLGFPLDSPGFHVLLSFGSGQAVPVADPAVSP